MRYRTNYRLWVITAGCLFALLGFVDPVAGVAKSNESFWSFAGTLLPGGYVSGELLASAVFRALLLAGPAVLAAWAVQAVIVVARSPRPGGSFQARWHSSGRPGA